MERTMRRLKGIMVCIFALLAVGCRTVSYSEERQTGMEEELIRTAVESLKEELGEKKIGERKGGVNKDKQDRIPQIENAYRNNGKYDSFLRKNLSDEQLHDDISSTPFFLEEWGEVNLVSATTDSRHSLPCFYITNNNGDILYRQHCMQGFVFWDVFVEDIDQDGRLDIWTVVCAEHSPEGGRLVKIFYQEENGYFYDEQEQGGEMPEEYYGDYQITQFCPTENYNEISEEILTEQEVAQMMEKDIVIQDGFFVSYDSERRIGTRGERGLSLNDSMITEYHYSECRWYSVSPDTLIHESYPDEGLREAVGEEYYEKINGIFYNVYVGWQQFYTLEGEEKLIMHSMLTGQNFILERKREK